MLFQYNIFICQAKDCTLDDKEIIKVRIKIIRAVKKQLGVKVRSTKKSILFL